MKYEIVGKNWLQNKFGRNIYTDGILLAAEEAHDTLAREPGIIRLVGTVDDSRPNVPTTIQCRTPHDDRFNSHHKIKPAQ